MPNNSDKTKVTSQSSPYLYAVGRRKRAIARVRLYPQKDTTKTADIVINDKPIDQYFPNPSYKLHYYQVLDLTNTKGKFSVTVKVHGSGTRSQLDAIKLGIARALVKADPGHKIILRENGLLTRDPRKKQRRMIGTGGKARRKKQSPKR